MNKLGFYTKNFGAPGVIEAIQEVKPPVLLTELDDKGVLRKMRGDWSPDTFVVGRFFFTPHHQAGGLGAAQIFPTAEQHQVCAVLRQRPQIALGRQFRGSIYNHGDAVGVGNFQGLRQAERGI